MTRNQWFAELSRLLSVLPKEEQKKAQDYYQELYADKEEAGVLEEEIIKEFGRPYDASREIISSYLQDNPNAVLPDYDRETGYAETNKRSRAPRSAVKEHPAEQKTTSSSEGNRTLWVLLCVLFAIPVACLYLTMAALAFGLWCAVFALIVSGIAVPIVSIVTESLSAGGILAVIGAGLLLIAVGLVLGTAVEFVVKWMFKGVSSFLSFLKKSIAGE